MIVNFECQCGWIRNLWDTGSTQAVVSVFTQSDHEDSNLMNELNRKQDHHVMAMLTGGERCGEGPHWEVSHWRQVLRALSSLATSHNLSFLASVCQEVK